MRKFLEIFKDFPYPTNFLMEIEPILMQDTNWEERFDNEFVFKDLGPDGDGNDAELPKWNEEFKSLGQKGYGTEYNQIEKIKRFILQEIKSK